MSDLPREIAHKIFLKFPARLLIRFSLVCKQWKSHISDPDFIRNHTNYALLDQSSWKLITHWNTPGDECSFYSVVSQSIDSETLISTNLALKLRFKTSFTPTIVASCNGMLLIDIHDFKRFEIETRILWNPLFGKMYRLLPRCISTLSHRTRLDGFGYDPTVDDYKVVILNRSRLRGNDLTRYSELRVEVYSLKTDEWKIIRGVPDTDIVCTYNTYIAGTRVNGSIYWIINDTRNGTVVIAFDLVTEKFKLMETLCGSDDVYHWWPLHLVDVRGYLGAYRSDRSAETAIWIWNEDENMIGSWTRLLTITTKDQIVKQILSFRNNNEVLLQATRKNSENLVIYDSESMMSRDIPCGNYTWPVHTVETLVSPRYFVSAIK